MICGNTHAVVGHPQVHLVSHDGGAEGQQFAGLSSAERLHVRPGSAVAAQAIAAHGIVHRSVASGVTGETWLVANYAKHIIYVQIPMK